MQKSDLKVLIVEDDSTLGAALKEAISRAGYSATLCPNAASAIKSFKVSDYRAVIMDCMLPGKNGIDLTQELRKEVNGDFLLLLTSGIFKDKAYIKDAINKTKAKTYFTKPFNINELIDVLDENLSEEFETEREPLFELLSTKNSSSQDRLKAIKQTSSIHGFDLPYVYSLLIGTQFSGDLTLSYPEAEPSVIGFSQGRISKVFHPDTESYFGVLLVENGFTSHEEVQENLALENEKPIGQRLIESHSLSPHAIQIVQNQQMIIRLSKTIQDTSVDIHLLELDSIHTSAAIEKFQFTPLLNDWISSKLDTEWLKAFYLSWLESPVLEGPEKAKLDLLNNLPLLQHCPQLLKLIEYPSTLQEILDSETSDEEGLLRAFHFLLLERVILFGSKAQKTSNFDKKIERLKKIKKTMSTQNFYEILGLSSDARPSEIDRTYKDLAKALHPDKLSPDSPSELVNLAKEVFALVSEAHQNLKDPENRQRYLKELKHGQAEDILASESLFDEGQRFIKGGRYRDALKCLEEAAKIKGHRSDLVVYLLWAKIKTGRGKTDFEKYFKDIRRLLSRIPHEERHNPKYFYVRGLYYVVKQDYRKAKAFFKHAVTLDPYFIEAKRELSSIRKIAKTKSGHTNVTGDLSSVVSKMFSKTNKKRRSS